MTPEEAKEIMQVANAPFRLVDQDGLTKMEWDPTEYVKSTAVNGPKALDAVETIAGMTYEYAVQARLEENGQWHQVTEWSADPNPYKPGHAPKHNERIVRRLVSQPEEVKP